MSLNKVMLIGNVGKDPEVRYLEGNAKVASFPLATTERYKDRSGEMKENTEWHNIVAWRNSADVAEKFIRKGTQVFIEGRIRTRNWTDQTGAKKYTTEIVVDNLELLGRRSDNPAADGFAPAAPSQQRGSQYGAPASGAAGGFGAGFGAAAGAAAGGFAPASPATPAGYGAAGASPAGFAPAAAPAAGAAGFAPAAGAAGFAPAAGASPAGFAPASQNAPAAPIDLGADDGSDDLPF